MKIHNDLYHQDIYFIPGLSEEDYDKFIRKFDPKYHSSIGSSYGYTTLAAGKVFIWLKDNKFENLGALCHECVHAANFILNDRGIKQDTNNDEALTYLAQWVFEKCLKHMRVK